jgi:hypothetical protein
MLTRIGSIVVTAIKILYTFIMVLYSGYLKKI